MSEEYFFVTDDEGKRYYASDIEKARPKYRRAMRILNRSCIYGGSSFVILVILFIATAIIGNNNAADCVMFFCAAVIALSLCGVMVGAMMWPDKPIDKFDREYEYYKRDLGRSAANDPAAEAPKAQQPHGATADEGTI